MLHAATLMEAWVEISDDNGARWTKLQEYKPHSTADSATCYVEAKTGQLFRMCLFDSTTGSTSIKMATHFFYDGHLAQASVKQAHDLPSTAVEGVRNGSGYLLPFRFKDLLTTNDEARACDTQASQDVGQLRIDLWRVDVIGPPEPPRHHDYTKTTAELFLEQRVKKKSGHQVGFGEAKVVEPQATLRTKKLDKKPFLTFRFNYLSEALLDLNKIRPFKIAAAPADPEVQAHASESNSSSTSAQPAAGASEQRAKSATVKIEKIPGSNALSSTQSKGKGRVINIDDDDDETELERLRAENARLRKKVKLENTGKKQVIDLSLD